MKAIAVEPGPRLVWTNAADPVAGPGQVILDVGAAGVNRADLLQAAGHYPPPPGASAILGLEVAGFANGRRVCALLPGGGYAEKAAVDVRMLQPLPDGWTFAQGAAFPEAWYTAYVNLFLEGGLEAGETVLIHAGASGVGTAAIQLARREGARVVVTAGSEEKVALCASLGADVAVNYRQEDFAERLGRDSVDLVIDCVGASYLARNLVVLKRFGRLVNIGLLGGAKAEIDLGLVLRKRLKMVGSTLRTRGIEEQVRIRNSFADRFWPALVAGDLRLVLDRTFPMQEAGEAHRYVSENRNAGKVVLVLD